MQSFWNCSEQLPAETQVTSDEVGIINYNSRIKEVFIENSRSIDAGGFTAVGLWYRMFFQRSI